MLQFHIKSTTDIHHDFRCILAVASESPFRLAGFQNRANRLECLAKPKTLVECPRPALPSEPLMGKSPLNYEADSTPCEVKDGEDRMCKVSSQSDRAWRGSHRAWMN